jgi:hypothetical protein
MRGGISSNRFVRGFVGIRGHIIRLLGHWGYQRLHGHSQALSTSQGEGEEDMLLDNSYPLGEREIKTKPIAVGGQRPARDTADMGSRPHTK